MFSALWVNTGRAQPPLMQTAQRPQMDGEMQRGPCVDGVGLSHEQERSSEAGCPVHGLWGHDARMRSQTHRTGRVWSCRHGKCTETGSKQVVPTGWGGGRGLLRGMEGSANRDGRCTVVNVLVP